MQSLIGKPEFQQSRTTQLVAISAFVSILVFNSLLNQTIRSFTIWQFGDASGHQVTMMSVLTVMALAVVVGTSDYATKRLAMPKKIRMPPTSRQDSRQ